MNILIPDSWLREHLSTTATKQQLQELLSLAGPSVERINEQDGESIYDIEITSNRADAFSIRGIAREAEAILNQAGIKAKLKNLPPSPDQSVANHRLPLPKVIDRQKWCRRNLGVVLTVNNPPATPSWMRLRLQQIGINSHGIIIDITNYVTHELGHPCHAFDYDSLMSLGGEIIITAAKPGQSFTTLDNQQYTSVGGEIVFTNSDDQIIDLPGIKGTLNTAITPETKRVLFWIESLPPEKIRFTSMTHAIRTVAAQLNEKQLDPSLASDTFYQAINYFRQHAKAEISSQILDHYPNPRQLPKIKVSLSKVGAYLGIELPPRQIVSILQLLNCQVELVAKNGGVIIVTPPAYRADLEIPADVIEEIARIYGYHRLPSKIMTGKLPLTPDQQNNFEIETKIKQILSYSGWQEVYTYSMVSQELAEKGGDLITDHLQIRNQLTEDHVWMRRQLWPSLHQVLLNHPRDKNQIYELSLVYLPTHTGKNSPTKENQPSLPTQEMHLSLVTNRGLNELRTALDQIAKQFYVSKLVISSIKTKNHSQKSHLAKISIVLNRQQHECGHLLQLDADTFVAELQLTPLIACLRKYPQYQPTITTSQIIEDITFTIKESHQLGQIIESWQQLSTWISKVEYLGNYQANHSFRITFTDREQHLESHQLKPIREAIVKLMAENWNAQLVGQLPV